MIASSNPATRREHGVLGDKPIRADAHPGAHNARAVEDPLTGQAIGHWHDRVRALAGVKEAGALANEPGKP